MSCRSRDYSVEAANGYFFGVESGNGICRDVFKTTYFYSHEVASYLSGQYKVSVEIGYQKNKQECLNIKDAGVTLGKGGK